MKSTFARQFFRTIIIFISVSLLMSVTFLVGASRIVWENQEEKMNAAMVTVNDYLRYRISAWPGLTVNEEAIRVLPVMAEIGDMAIQVADVNGKIILSSDISETSPVGMQLTEAMLQDIQRYRRLTAAQMQPYVAGVQSTQAAPLTVALSEDSSVVVGYILVSSSQKSYVQLMNQFYRSWLLLTFAVVMFAAISAYLTAQRISRPLRQMAMCAHSFAHGDFSVRTDPKSTHDGETRELSYAFNAMADALENAEELRRGFIANVSHELKTPMTTIAGFIGGVIDGTIPEERRQETLQIVHEEVMRLSRMITSMSNLSRIQTGQFDLRPKPFDLCETSLRVFLGFEKKITDKGLQVELDLSEGSDLWVQADPDLMIQVMTNLLDNAVKFASPGGRVYMGIHEHAGKAVVTVTNEGPGIPPEELPYVFDRYHKADRSRSQDRTGLGLGLFLVRSILYAHNEDIHVSSEENETTFSFSLSLTKNRA